MNTKALALALIFVCIPIGDLNAGTPLGNLKARKEAFAKCQKREVEVFYRNVTDRGNEEGGRDWATQACAKYLTKEEIECADSAQYGVQIGDPFRCEKSR
jgi:hypothetical protein